MHSKLMSILRSMVVLAQFPFCAQLALSADGADKEPGRPESPPGIEKVAGFRGGIHRTNEAGSDSAKTAITSHEASHKEDTKEANPVKNQSRLPDRAGILRAMVQANDYFMGKWPDPSKEIVVGKVRPSNIWTRAVYYEGLMALYQVDRNERYIRYARQWGESHKWVPGGKLPTRNADNQCCGQTYLDLYLCDKNPEQIRGIRASIDLMMADGKVDDWSWIDALQMAMPVFARLGEITGDARYFEKMHLLYEFTKTRHGGAGLYNQSEHLWWRDKDFVPPYKEPNGRNCYWSRGNGWVLAAMVRVLDILPVNAPHRDEYVRIFREMAEALLPLQREDGFWNVSLHDPGHFGGKELSGTALFTYGMAWGINHGVLPEDRYSAAVAKAWHGMVSDALHPDGKLGYVQGTGKQPSDGQPVAYDSVPDFEDFGLGCFLLAGSEVMRMK